MELENESVNTTTGSTFTLKCTVNLPVDHIYSLEWISWEPAFLPHGRYTIKDSFSQGYSILKISDVSFADAGQYRCKVILLLRNDKKHVATTASVTVTGKNRSWSLPVNKTKTETLDPFMTFNLLND